MTFLRGHASGLEGTLPPNHPFAHDSSSVAQIHTTTFHLLLAIVGLSCNHFGGMRTQ
jgi:hypothetical protein